MEASGERLEPCQGQGGALKQVLRALHMTPLQQKSNRNLYNIYVLSQNLIHIAIFFRIIYLVFLVIRSLLIFLTYLYDPLSHLKFRGRSSEALLSWPQGSHAA